ncbi:MAG TPA: hypothetical protein VG389_01860 [Myxococcota bacterium]|nr:hypothetical protein [Myxococcota bacterium]
MNLPPRELRHGSITIRIGAQGGHAVAFEGVLREQDDGAWLRGVVAEVHHAAVTQRMQELMVDLRALEYCNATAWKCFVEWVRVLRHDPEAHYLLRVVSNPEHRWQAVGMSALRVFGGDRLVIEGRSGK